MTPTSSARMITIVAWGFIVVSIVWGLAPYQQINAPARIFLDILDWPYGDAAPVLDRSAMWLSSIGAGLSIALSRSEERRVGKECRSRWSPDH